MKTTREDMQRLTQALKFAVLVHGMAAASNAAGAHHGSCSALIASQPDLRVATAHTHLGSFKWSCEIPEIRRPITDWVSFKIRTRGCVQPLPGFDPGTCRRATRAHDIPCECASNLRPA